MQNVLNTGFGDCPRVITKKHYGGGTGMEKRRKPKQIRSGISVCESSAFLRSSREITVCGCKKVLHYAPDTVKLLLSDGVMEISGEGITAATYFGREIKLSGKIDAINLYEGE